MKHNFLILALFLIGFQPGFGQVATDPPNPPEISAITVLTNGSVQINWFPEPAADGYIIYRSKIYDNEADGNPIDTFKVSDVNGSDVNEYIDSVGVDARTKSIGYYMSSYIYLSNGEVKNGIAGDWHYTIYLNNIEFDSCTNTNTLRWNKYIGWDVAYYNVYRDEIANPITVGLGNTVYADNIVPGITHSYYIRAFKKNNLSIKSESNRVTKTTNALTLPDNNLFYISRLENRDNAIDFLVQTDIAADVLGYQLMAGESETSFSPAVYLPKDNTALVNFTHTDENQPLFYKVAAIGVCNDTLAETNHVKPIVLTAPNSDETQVTLEWNNSFIYVPETFTVTVKIDNGAEFEIETLIGTSATYNFADIADENAEAFWFTVKATDGNNNTSISNKILISRTAKIIAPNAFTPNSDGINDYFGPFWNKSDTENSYIKNAVIVEFNLIIYDKYGGIILKTDNSNYRWNGDIRGKAVTEGGYIYYLWFKTAQQKTYEQSGTINVVYP